jgi:hypothetical protein
MVALSVSRDAARQPDGGHDLSGRAVAVLGGVVFDEGRLYRMQFVIRSNAFNRGDHACLRLTVRVSQALIGRPSNNAWRRRTALDRNRAWCR